MANKDVYITVLKRRCRKCHQTVWLTVDNESCASWKASLEKSVARRTRIVPAISRFNWNFRRTSASAWHTYPSHLLPRLTSRTKNKLRKYRTKLEVLKMQDWKASFAVLTFYMIWNFWAQQFVSLFTSSTFCRYPFSALPS